MSRGLTDESEYDEVVESQVTRVRVLKGVPMQGSLGHFYESVAEDYRSYRLGDKTGRKDRENAQNIARHCLVFCAYMLEKDGDEDDQEHSVGSPAAAGPTNDLTFLSNIKRLRHFPTYLRARGYAVTSVRNMLISISVFLNHVQNSFMLQSRLSTSDIGRAHYELKKLRSDINRDIMARQQQFKRVKTSTLPQASDEVHFLDTAKKCIPQLFDSLISEDTTTVVTDHNLLIGYIMGYLSIISGHRSTVLTEMEASDVMDADSWNNGQLFQLLVGSHKTDLTYGHAFIVLEDFEMILLQKMCRSECCNHGIQPLFVFHTIVGSPVYKANKYLAAAWRDAGLDNPVTFGAIRSSVATQVNEASLLFKVHLRWMEGVFFPL
ncbi:uncharacterized protein LOC112143027 [Oryzias melastigma]|uniref:uncharacterized protein LOC112143027 n=1 Tax=Oryzias melastigma TaxID=30732 RepID=UPI00168CE0A9|nr:uncharacterized protein LOC112143027 [Oryzias melastigma]